MILWLVILIAVQDFHSANKRFMRLGAAQHCDILTLVASGDWYASEKLFSGMLIKSYISTELDVCVHKLRISDHLLLIVDLLEGLE